jgi:hypothetical protein
VVWGARFLNPAQRALPVLLFFPSNHQPSNLVCSAEILGRGAKVPEKTAAAITDPG